MGQSDLKNILVKVLLGVIWAVLFAFFLRLIQRIDVKRNRPSATEKKLDFLVNRQLFCSKYHLFTKLIAVFCVGFTVLELVFVVRRENVLDLKMFPDYTMFILILLALGISVLFSFLDNQIAIKQGGIWCKFGFTEKIVKKGEIISVILNNDGALIIRLENESEIVLKGLKNPDRAKESLQSLMDTKI